MGEQILTWQLLLPIVWRVRVIGHPFCTIFISSFYLFSASLLPKWIQSMKSIHLPMHHVSTHLYPRAFTNALYFRPAASVDQISLNEPHPPRENSIEAFGVVLGQIKREIIKSRKHWDKHEPKMWSRSRGLTDGQLTGFTLENDLILVSGAGNYCLHVLPCLMTVFAVRSNPPVSSLQWVQRTRGFRTFLSS